MHTDNFGQNWHSTWKAQKALKKISGFASVISESYNQDDAGEIEDIMKLASQMGRSLYHNDGNDNVWILLFASYRRIFYHVK